MLEQHNLLATLNLGVIDIVRTQLWREGGSAKCVQMRARGEGGIAFEYAHILALTRPPIYGF